MPAKPLSPAWRHVTESVNEEGKKVQSCNYCAKSAVWSATRVVTHLVGCASFKSARPEEWLEITKLVPPSTKHVSAAVAVESARATGARAWQNATEGIGSVATNKCAPTIHTATVSRRLPTDHPKVTVVILGVWRRDDRFF